MTGFDLDAWLQEGHLAKEQLHRRRQELFARIEADKAELEDLDAKLAKLNEALGGSAESSRMYGVTASVRFFFSRLKNGDSATFEDVEKSVITDHDGEVPNRSSVRSAIVKLVDDGYLSRKDDRFVKTGDLPGVADIRDEVQDSLKSRLRVAGEVGVLPMNWIEERMLDFWSGNELVVKTADGTYRLTDKASLLPEDAPIPRHPLFAAQPPRHAQ